MNDGEAGENAQCLPEASPVGGVGLVSPQLKYAVLRLREYAAKPITMADGKRFVVVLPEDAETILQALAVMSPRDEEGLKDE